MFDHHNPALGGELRGEGVGVAAGVSSPGLIPEEVARALVLMTERYLIDADAFGLPSDRLSLQRTGAVVGAVQIVWLRAL